MKKSLVVFVASILVQGCIESEPVEQGGAALMPVEGDPGEPLPDPEPAPEPAIDVIPAGKQAQRLGIVEWELSADGAAEVYGLTGIAADGSVVQSIELFGDANGVTLVGSGGGIYTVDLDGNVVTNTLAAEERTLLAAAQPDLEAEAAVEMLRPSRACVIWTGITLGLAVACGAGAWAACIGLVGAFCNASNYCGNNVCGH